MFTGKSIQRILYVTLLSIINLALLKTHFYSRGLRTGSATEWSLLWAALYKFRNTIRWASSLS